MRKLLPCVVSILFAAAPILTEAASASDESKDDDCRQHHLELQRPHT